MALLSRVTSEELAAMPRLSETLESVGADLCVASLGHGYGAAFVAGDDPRLFVMKRGEPILFVHSCLPRRPNDPASSPLEIAESVCVSIASALTTVNASDADVLMKQIGASFEQDGTGWL